MDLKDFTENEQEEIEKNEQIYFKTISRYLVCIDCPPCYISSRASDTLVFPR